MLGFKIMLKSAQFVFCILNKLFKFTTHDVIRCNQTKYSSLT